MQHKVVLIGVYMGDLPPWINFYLKTCQLNKEFDWLFFVTRPPKFKANNITYVTMSAQELSRLITNRIGVQPIIENPRKICDFKPAFGFLFNDYIKGYDFWAHVDWDIIWGDMQHFLTAEMLQRYDIISTYPYTIAGACTFYRSVPLINSLFMENPYYEEVFGSSKHVAFDEIGSHMPAGQFAFGRTVLDYEKRGQIKVLFKRLHKLDSCDDLWWGLCQEKMGQAIPKDETFSGSAYWENGKVFLKQTKEETMFFHFMEYKKNIHRLLYLAWCEDIVSFEVGPQGFKIKTHGIVSSVFYFAIALQNSILCRLSEFWSGMKNCARKGTGQSCV